MCQALGKMLWIRYLKSSQRPCESSLNVLQMRKLDIQRVNRLTRIGELQESPSLLLPCKTCLCVGWHLEQMPVTYLSIILKLFNCFWDLLRKFHRGFPFLMDRRTSQHAICPEDAPFRQHFSPTQAQILLTFLPSQFTFQINPSLYQW